MDRMKGTLREEEEATAGPSCRGAEEAGEDGWLGGCRRRRRICLLGRERFLRLPGGMDLGVVSGKEKGEREREERLRDSGE